MRIKRHRAAGAFPALSVLAALLVSASCLIAVVERRDAERPAVSLGEVTKTFPLDFGGSLGIENVAGRVEIEGWEREEVRITVVEEMRFPGSPRLAFLGAEGAKPDIRAEGDERELRIIISSLKKRAEHSEFHCRLRVPRSIVLRNVRTGRGDITLSSLYGTADIRGGEGDVTVRNFSGSLSVVLERGDVEAEVLDLRPQDEVEVTVDDGDIMLFFEPGVSAEIFAEAPRGDVSGNFESLPLFEPPVMRAKLGEGGGGRVVLTARNGDIQIKKIED